MPRRASASTIAGGRARLAPSAIFNATARPSGSAAANTPSAPSLAISPGTWRMNEVTSRRSPPTISGCSVIASPDGVARRPRLAGGDRPERASQPDQRHHVRRRAAAVDTDVRHRAAGELGDGVGDRQLQRVVDVQVAVVVRPAVHDARGQHAAVLAAAVHLQRRAPTAVAQHLVGRVLVERQVGGVPERLLVEAGTGEDAPRRAEVRRRSVVAGAHQREQLGRQVEPVAHHRHRLHRLVRRSRVHLDLRVAEGEGDRAVGVAARRRHRSAPTRRTRCAR